MLKRKISEKLVEWKTRENRKPLLISGARQVGKTFIIREFAKNQYKSVIEINFADDPTYAQMFIGAKDIHTIIKQIRLRMPNSDIVEGETLLFLDEIQLCGDARTALKFLAFNKTCDVIASGSLLGISYANVVSYPVGYVERMTMFSLDFEEFLWAFSINQESIDDIKKYYKNREVVPLSMHNRMLELFKDYIVIGGMPEVVDTFAKEHNYARVLQLQRAIIDDYYDDIIKYAEGSEKTKARACFASIPTQLAKDYKKFQYSTVEKKGDARKYGGSLMWLYDAGIINFCYNLSQPQLPLKGNVIQDCFKVYMNDTGLLVSMLEDGTQRDIIDGNLGIYKGAIYENIIAEIFTKKSKDLFYFEYRNRLEMDFIIRHNDVVTAIEVKSSENRKSKSMYSIIQNHGVQAGIKLSTGNVGVNENVVSYPLYMAMFL